MNHDTVNWPVIVHELLMRTPLCLTRRELDAISVRQWGAPRDGSVGRRWRTDFADYTSMVIPVRCTACGELSGSFNRSCRRCIAKGTLTDQFAPVSPSRELTLPPLPRAPEEWWVAEMVADEEPGFVRTHWRPVVIVKAAAMTSEID